MIDIDMRLIYFLIILFVFFLYNSTIIHNRNHLRILEPVILNRIVILILCHDKVTDFQNMLSSLFKVRGVPSRVDIIVSQSGLHKEVYDIAISYGLTVIQHEDHDTSTEHRLANHFRWSFEKVFEMYPDSNGLIVLEDDFLFSPDFLEYFELTIPLLDVDPTLFTVSAWNDNGFKQNTHDLHNIKRVSFFPGLGWYLSRKTWNNELASIWPTSDWDWVIRKYVETNKLEIIIPEISRDYHAASSGTYMKKDLFYRYFKNIRMNTDNDFRWNNDDILSLDYMSYKDNIIKELNDNVKNKVIFATKQQLKSASFSNNYEMWHAIERGAWNGIRIIWDTKDKQYVYIIDSFSNPEWNNYRLPSVTL